MDKPQLTEAEAWRRIGEAFEAKSVEYIYDPAGLSGSGICHAITVLYRRYNAISLDLFGKMYDKVWDEVQAQIENKTSITTAYLLPRPHDKEGWVLRALLCYLFSEELERVVRRDFSMVVPDGLDRALQVYDELDPL